MKEGTGGKKNGSQRISTFEFSGAEQFFTFRGSLGGGESDKVGCNFVRVRKTVFPKSQTFLKVTVSTPVQEALRLTCGLGSLIGRGAEFGNSNSFTHNVAFRHQKQKQTHNKARVQRGERHE